MPQPEREPVTAYRYTEWDYPQCGTPNRREGDSRGADASEDCHHPVEVG